ncbi:recombinase family protein [Sphingopyxis sp. USTB-05]|uniref:recombinase family protein n=1 Tax=Sphingopyxis sp. USTB-05 TaxID=2830667 RepID=UPI00220E1C76|nr:recombinase family protein [Sphingopyxis sp. USTB-05]
MVETYVEAGTSGLTDRRPALQRTIADACAQPKHYDAVFVHNFCRCFRDEYECEGYRRKLEKAGVKLISATQDVGEGPQPPQYDTATLVQGLSTPSSHILLRANVVPIGQSYREFQWRAPEEETLIRRFELSAD